jgi:hypothetical protein
MKYIFVLNLEHNWILAESQEFSKLVLSPQCESEQSMKWAIVLCSYFHWTVEGLIPHSVIFNS